MNVVIALFFISGIIVFLVTARRLSRTIENDAAQQITFADQVFREVVRKKDALYLKKMETEEEAFKIFTLYEITREITKSLSEKEAFQIFKNKLAQHVSFQDSFLLDPSAKEVKQYKNDPECFIFNLQGKDEVIGILVVKGVREEDREKVRILGHQFALALRRVRLYQKIGKVAITDELTGVNTRRYVMERLEEEIARCKLRGLKMSFLMIDVDYFKNLNDRYGHLTGDQVLRNVGQIIRDNIREIDIPGRYGGEEFCVILPETNPEGAFYAAERIRKAAEQEVIRAYDETIKVTMSLGIATYPDHGASLQEIVDKADWALYRSKKRGRNTASAFGVFDK
jgi:diguanylate cyclase (GGDEF)-like protein